MKDLDERGRRELEEKENEIQTLKDKHNGSLFLHNLFIFVDFS
jgi:hypothetical protein